MAFGNSLLRIDGAGVPPPIRHTAMCYGAAAADAVRHGFLLDSIERCAVARRVEYSEYAYAREYPRANKWAPLDRPLQGSVSRARRPRHSPLSFPSCVGLRLQRLRSVLTGVLGSTHGGT